MATIVIIGAVAMAGAYLRWATGPVLVAYQVGRMLAGSCVPALPPAAPAGAAGAVRPRPRPGASPR